MLSDLSYSHSEDSSIDNVIRKSKRHFNYSTGNELETKVSEASIEYFNYFHKIWQLF